ncbi:MAG TPA: DUF4168 domain-containing protein [bacterium]|nr:DUF4168 domain-containing protein [bacterium]
MVNRLRTKHFLIVLSALLASLFFIVTCSSEQGETQTDARDTQTQQMSDQSPAQSEGGAPDQSQQQLSAEQQQQLQQQQAPSVEVNDEELETFSNALQTIQTIYEDAQPNMVAAIKEEGMEPNRFSQIAQSQQNPQSDLDVSDQEMQKFNSALTEIREIQSGIIEKQKTAVKEEGMSPERFQEILTAVRQDQQLQQRLQSMQ